MSKVKYEKLYGWRVIEELGKGDVFMIDKSETSGSCYAIRNMSYMTICSINKWLEVEREENTRIEFYKIVPVEDAE